MRTLLERRKASQPLEYPSCGSVFKNPEDASAGALIDEVGLKGSMCGGAQISEKHANFIVNKNKACASDVLALIKRAQEKVKEHYGIELQPEVKFLWIRRRVQELIRPQPLPSSVKGRPSQDRSVRMPQNNRAAAKKQTAARPPHGVFCTALICDANRIASF